MAKLTEMAVSRVDGVDKPAIRKRWVLVKSEDAASTEVEKDYAGAARAAVEAILKEGVEFSDETVEVLRALVDLLELDVEFAAKSDETDTDPDDDPEADEVAKNDKMLYTAEEAEALVAKALKAAGIDVAAITKSTGNEDGTAALRVAKSKQPKDQEGGAEARTVTKGTGLFSNIINGDAAQPYSG